MTQHEKPGITPLELTEKLGLPPAAAEGARVSGGQIENFRRGWAVPIFTGGRSAHWFERDGFDQARSLCAVTSAVRWLYGAGTYPRCQNCIRIMSRQLKVGRLK